MTINERVSPKRLAEIISRAEVFDDSVLTDYRDIESIARELQQYRGAAELEVSDDELNAALTVHRLKTDGHSQLSDAFRAGYKYARRAAPQVTSVPDGDNRKAFEIAAKAIGYVDEFYFHTNTHPNYYDDDRINDMWNMWNACRAAMLAAPAVQAERPVVQLPVEFYSEHGIVVQLEKVLAALAVQGVKYERRGLAKGQLFGNTEQVEHVSQPYTLPLDYLQGHKDGCEWAARMAEANHPQTGDWLFDDPIELAKAIRKGPDMLPAEPGNSPAIPDGWQLVPKEATPEMLNASWVSHGVYHPSAYRTMLAAAPAAPQQEAE